MENNMFSKLTEDVKQAMKDGNNCKRDCLRMVIAEIKNITVNAGKETTDEDCMRVLRFYCPIQRSRSRRTSRERRSRALRDPRLFA